MKKNYNKSIQLRCVVCGSDSDFEYNADKTYVLCAKCNREYAAGYDELVELNKGLIDKEIELTAEEITIDLQEEFTSIFKEAYKGNKYFKLK